LPIEESDEINNISTEVAMNMKTAEERYRQAVQNSDRVFAAFERRILVHRIEDLDREIAETRCWIAKHGPDERDIEFIRLAENLRALWIKELQELDRKLRDLDRPQQSLGEMMIEACGSGQPPIGQSKLRSLPPASSKKPT
jgi:hypothetical protein